MKLTSHVGRDLLATAATFHDEAAVVWEYVVNSLQYVDPGVRPRVQVEVRPRRKEIQISDNGRGMSAEDLRRFFTMHAENLDRKQGRLGRGKFGTGKSAAFGVAQSLQIESRRGGLRNVVQLDREMVDRSSGGDIPLNWLARDEAVELPDGTTVLISGILLKKIDQTSIIEYVERHLQVFRAVAPEVAVGTHVCSYREPAVRETRTFQPSRKQSHLNYAQIHFASVAAFVAGWRSS